MRTILLLFLLYIVGGTNGKLGNPRGDLSQEGGFPKVYTARVPSPLSLSKGGGESFVASLDLLDARPAENNTKSSEWVVTFLVHSKQELKHIQKLASKLTVKSLEPDTEETSKYTIIKSSGQEDLNLQRSTIEGFSCYRNLAGMEQLMVDLEKQAATIPNLDVTLIDIGDSFVKTQNASQGYDIWALNITGNGVAARGLTTEKGIFFGMTGLHAREYAPPELGARFLEMLVNGYGNDAEITAILDHTEIHWVLHANPDGRAIAEVSPQLFRRKNLNGSEAMCSGGSYGVDLNRNFPFRFGLNSGSSAFPCSQTYRGAAPASEPEVHAIVNYVSSIFPEEQQRKVDPEGQINDAFPENITGIFFDLHSFGEIIIWPWSYANQETPNDDDMETLVRKYQSFNQYDFAGPNMNFLYPASGTTDDWAYGVLGLPGMTFEIGTRFYQACDHFDNEIFPRNLPALLYAAKTTKAPYLISKGPDVTSLLLPLSPLEMSNSSTLNVRVQVSDRALSSDNFFTSQQNITSVRLYIDTHPYDVKVNGENVTTVAGVEMNGSFTSGTVTATSSLSFSQLLDMVHPPVVGLHTLHVQGTDSDGYTGPVTATYFEIVESSEANNSTAPECHDSSTESFTVDADVVGERDCHWLSSNMFRFDYLCDLVEIARLCPKTCSHCEFFG